MTISADAIRLCLFSDLENGSAKGFDPENTGTDKIFVVRQGDKPVAYFNACPHQGYEGTTMAWRKDAYLNGAGDRIVCSGHGAQFDIYTGACLIGPCLGQNLKKARVELADDGYLYWHMNT